MIGTLIPTEKKVVVIGAGISGLLIAYFLKKKGYEVTVYESKSKAGGLIQSPHTPFGLVEKAAHSLLVGPDLEGFFSELDVRLVPVCPNSKARFIYRNGKMRRFPLTFFETIKTLVHFFSKPKTILNLQACSLEEWGVTYLGPAATQFLLSPFVTGVYACTPSDLNARITFPKLVPTNPLLSLFEHIRIAKKKSEKKKRSQMMVPLNGMQDLIEKLEIRLKDEIRYDTPIEQIPTSANIVLSVPAQSLAKLIAKDDPVSAEKLLKVTYAPLITITVFYNKASFKTAPRGVGVLVPRNEGLRLLGCLFNSSSFPNRSHDENVVSLTVMYGGTADPDALNLDDAELVSMFKRELSILFAVKDDPLHFEITRYTKAIPLYSHDLKIAQDSLKIGFSAHPGRVIFSNFSKEVSIRGLIETLQKI